MYKRYDIYKTTTDDWYPSYKLDNGLSLVRVSFFELIPYHNEPTLWRVCVWGEDDCGMEKDFESETISWTCFLEIIGLDDITRESLIVRGFISA